MILRYLIVIGISVVVGIIVGIIVGITEAISLDAGDRLEYYIKHYK